MLKLNVFSKKFGCSQKNCIFAMIFNIINTIK